MTVQEAKGFIQGKIDCMDRCDVFDCKHTDECESCNYCYSQGNFGEQKNALKFAIESMKELEQYRALGTVEELKEAREKQVAKKPIEYEDKYYACPRCEGIVMYKWDEYPTKLKSKKYGLPYCLGCGQKLDWSEEDD